MGRRITARAAALTCTVSAVLLAGCTAPKPAAPAPTNVTMSTLSTNVGRVAVGKAVNLRLVPPVGATGSWVVERSGLTAGLSFNAATGVISGTPTAAEIWYLRLRFQVTGGSSANVLPVYEIVGSASHAVPTDPPPPGTTFAHSIPLVVHLNNQDVHKWVLNNDGTLVTEDSTVAASFPHGVSASEYDYQAGAYFPYVYGYDCADMRMALPSSLLNPAVNAPDHVTVPGADPGSNCSAGTAVNHRAAAVVETRGSDLRVHMLGVDMATELWATDVAATQLPYSGMYVAGDGSMVAFSSPNGGTITVVTPSGSTAYTPMDSGGGQCQLTGDNNNRVGDSPTKAPIWCTLNTGGRSVGYINLSTGAVQLHALPVELSDAWDDRQFQQGYSVFSLRGHTPEWGFAGLTLWVVNYDTGDAQMVYQYNGDTDPSVGVQLFPKP